MGLFSPLTIGNLLKCVPPFPGSALWRSAYCCGDPLWTLSPMNQKREKKTRSVHYTVQDLALRISNALNGTTDCFNWLPDWCSSVSKCDP